MTPPETNAATAGEGVLPGRPADGRIVTAALYVDLEGLRARYECVLCHAIEGPVHGADDVTAFAAEIRAAHRGRCAALQENRS